MAGVPLAAVLGPANVHDTCLLAPTLDAVAGAYPSPRRSAPGRRLTGEADGCVRVPPIVALQRTGEREQSVLRARRSRPSIRQVPPVRACSRTRASGIRQPRSHDEACASTLTGSRDRRRLRRVGRVRRRAGGANASALRPRIGALGRLSRRPGVSPPLAADAATGTTVSVRRFPCPVGTRDVAERAAPRRPSAPSRPDGSVQRTRLCLGRGSRRPGGVVPIPQPSADLRRRPAPDILLGSHPLPPCR
jgi:hypothetical protein